MSKNRIFFTTNEILPLATAENIPVDAVFVDADDELTENDSDEVEMEAA